MDRKKFFGDGLPGVKLDDLKGRLIVIEGADCSGRSTQIRMLRDWLERLGYATTNVGLTRSTLVSAELNEAKKGNVLGYNTRSLFYATDFADQLENSIIPALRAGFIVLADRYIYTLIARDLVRGTPRDWVESIYGIALQPDIVFYLRVSPRQLIERNFRKSDSLDYWESGMDMALGRDMFTSFVKYQKLLRREFKKMEDDYGFVVVDGNRRTETVFRDIRRELEELLIEDGEIGNEIGPSPRRKAKAAAGAAEAPASDG